MKPKDIFLQCPSCGFKAMASDLERSCSNCFACTGCRICICQECGEEIVVKEKKTMNRGQEPQKNEKI